MTPFTLARASLVHYRRTHAAVGLGVASAVAVLAGSMLVGGSVRASLATITEQRLGRTDLVVTAETPFKDDLGSRVADTAGAAIESAPMLVFEGTVRHETSGRVAARVRIYGVDERYFRFHLVSHANIGEGHVLASPDLARELAAATGDTLVVRVPRWADVPSDSLYGRKDNLERAMRLEYEGVLPSPMMGEFSIGAGQGAVRAVFVQLGRMQRDLALFKRVNTVLLAASSSTALNPDEVRRSLASVVRADDLGLTVDPRPDLRTIIVESLTGLLAEPIRAAVMQAAARELRPAAPVLTWLATRMSVGGRSVPYSLVAAVDPSSIAEPSLGRYLAGTAVPPPLVLNDWAMRDLDAHAGDPIEIEFFRWADEGRLETDRATFTVSGVVPMIGVTGDPRLAPVYPGISDSTNIANWDPPFPIELPRVRPVDEDYWQKFRATPKAFIPLAAGQRLWTTRYGSATSIRIGALSEHDDLDGTAIRLRDTIARAIDPAAAGMVVTAVRRQNLAAASGVTDFGAYFTYFSFFLMVSGLLLAGLFFRLAVEQRFGEIGVLRATGVTLGTIRKIFLVEAAVVASLGAAAGIVLAIIWAAVMMFGLRTWWLGAVGTSELQLRPDVGAVAIGALSGLAAGLASIAITLRGLARVPPRALLTGSAFSGGAGIRPASRGPTFLALTLVIAAVSLAGFAYAGSIRPEAGFFGAAALTLIAGLVVFRRWLLQPPHIGTRRGAGGLLAFGIRNAGWRPGRSLVSTGLVAAACFLLVSVESFRRGVESSIDPHSGTGGFGLIAEAGLPFTYDPATREGQIVLGLDGGADAADFAGVTFMPARVRRGDDASCLNLFRPSRPRIVGVPPRWIDAGRFRFASSIAADPTARENPWRLLGPPDAEGIVPAIADATSLQYVLHARVGDVITIDQESSRPARLRLVAALDDSVLQSELIVADAAFTSLFPSESGYRMLFVDVPVSPDRAARLTRLTASLESRLEPFGVDVQDAEQRLAAYHRVENTYLSTFQALGGLGIILGSLGLAAIVARNVLERRRELALLIAAGFTGTHVQLVVLGEQIIVITAGIVIGVGAAAIAVSPVLASRRTASLLAPLCWTLAVFFVGLAASALATRRVRRLPLVASLRGE